MKTILTFLTTGMCLFGSLLNAQTNSTFDNLSLASESYWYGNSPSDNFTSGNGTFPSVYDTAWMYWSGGWAYSNRTDSVTDSSSFTQAFTAKAGAGYMSSNYSVGQNWSVVRLNGLALGGQVNGAWITNSNYAYNSMYFGDSFGKQFGGVTGNDTDWFRLTIKRYYMGVLQNDSVDFYLADYRFSNNSQDYLVRNWTWVDLSSLGNCDSLLFTLNSSDVGQFGMNTPAFFCMDELQTADSPTGIEGATIPSVTAYPNPASNFVTLTGDNLQGSTLNICNSMGQIIESAVLRSNTETLNLTNLAEGIYQLVIIDPVGRRFTQTIIKE